MHWPTPPTEMANIDKTAAFYSLKEAQQQRHSSRTMERVSTLSIIYAAIMVTVTLGRQSRFN